jgi:hypothetical protein
MLPLKPTVAQLHDWIIVVSQGMHFRGCQAALA